MYVFIIISVIVIQSNKLELSIFLSNHNFSAYVRNHILLQLNLIVTSWEGYMKTKQWKTNSFDLVNNELPWFLVCINSPNNKYFAQSSFSKQYDMRFEAINYLLGHLSRNGVKKERECSGHAWGLSCMNCIYTFYNIYMVTRMFSWSCCFGVISIH